MQQSMQVACRDWIAAVLQSHLPLAALAVRQRAKFEGWLKFEIANHIERIGAHPVLVETSDSGGIGRSDITFFFDAVRYDIELKTPNTNWSVPGITTTIHRPITKNIDAIPLDARKLLGCSGYGLVAFVLFPVPVSDNRWTVYLDRIGSSLGIGLSEKEHCTRIRIPLGKNAECDIVICCFQYPVAIA